MTIKIGDRLPDATFKEKTDSGVSEHSTDDIFKGRKVTSQNPWKATTLEWTTKINPGHGNWEGEIPEVHRWAYDYSKDGRDFIPQTEPVGANESKH